MDLVTTVVWRDDVTTQSNNWGSSLGHRRVAFSRCNQHPAAKLAFVEQILLLGGARHGIYVTTAAAKHDDVALLNETPISCTSGVHDDSTRSTVTFLERAATSNVNDTTIVVAILAISLGKTSKYIRFQSVLATNSLEITICYSQYQLYVTNDTITIASWVHFKFDTR